MRVRLADVGEIPDLFAIGRGPARSRSMRRAAGGEGGGGGTDDDTGTEDTDDKDTDDDADDKDDDAEEDDDSDDAEKDKKETEFEKLKRRAARRDRELRRVQAELAQLRDKDKDDKPDPVAEANGRIVRTAAHGILRGLGVTDKDERAAVLDILRLDDIDVDDDGADEDAIEDRIDELRRILGAGGPTSKRVPKTKTRDRGGNDDTPADPDRARYRRILSKGR